MSTGTRSLPNASPVPYFQPIERGHVSEGGLSDMDSQGAVTFDTKDIYPDLYLPVVGKYRISDKFYGYSDSLSADNNLMILVELKGLSYHNGTSIYAVDRIKWDNV